MRVRLVAVAVLASVFVAVIAPTAQADQISRKRNEARKIATEVSALQAQAEQLAEDYNDARLRLAALNVDVNEAKARLDKNRASMSAVQDRMSSWALQAYVNASQGDPVFAAFGGSDTTDSAGYQGYTAIAVGVDVDLSDQLRQSGEDVAQLQSDLANRQKLVGSVKAELASKKQQVEATQAKTQKLLAKTTGELRSLVAAEEERQRLAEERVIRAQIEARRAARRAAAGSAASSAGSGASSGSVAGAAPLEPVHHTPPAPSPGAAGAVEQAMSQIGVLYRWAQDSPEDGFDCSGLTSWAWGRVGVSIPHSSRAQWNNLPQVDAEDLEPGDLVFFGSPVHHVGMYIGNGQMVHAPQSGERITVASIYRRDLRGGRRPG